ncbi:MAG: RloB family protein [Bacteroidia bacterium]
MILRQRPFSRKPPDKDAKSIFIFCEGKKREYQYFRYFREMDSRVNIEVYELSPDENNSPLGLLNIAKSCIIKSDENPEPRYDFLEGDEVWLVIDIDLDKTGSRIEQIEEVKSFCDEQKGWHLVQSNPCFEVWLYYHFFHEKPSFTDEDKCSGWKTLLDSSVNGGFNSNKHPILIESAIHTSRRIHAQAEGLIEGTTEVYLLGESIFGIMERKINSAITKMERNN